MLNLTKLEFPALFMNLDAQIHLEAKNLGNTKAEESSQDRAKTLMAGRHLKLEVRLLSQSPKNLNPLKRRRETE
ncbi:hypothetical protein GIB67_004514 [Kingdonia uniflora]|uniref:Uncharacterized protein n=1 Tax=Kingdonia uniflora TaxID=39325 RepID=A0A7J7LSF3_9MAGN|nr:hypothetical protein GIB67_004514 [Kingdonia uniflora]